MSAKAILPVRVDGARRVDPIVSKSALDISDALDQNDLMRGRLVRLRKSVKGEGARVRVDHALGRLARVHVQLNAALREVEKAGGAS